MVSIKIHVLRCGQVHTTRYLPFNKEKVGMIKMAGAGVRARDWVWMPVSCYYIEHPKGKILVDTAWSRRMSPAETEGRKAQILCEFLSKRAERFRGLQYCDYLCSRLRLLCRGVAVMACFAPLKA